MGDQISVAVIEDSAPISNRLVILKAKVTENYGESFEADYNSAFAIPAKFLDASNEETYQDFLNGEAGNPYSESEMVALDHAQENNIIFVNKFLNGLSRTRMEDCNEVSLVEEFSEEFKLAFLTQNGDAISHELLGTTYGFEYIKGKSIKKDDKGRYINGENLSPDQQKVFEMMIASRFRGTNLMLTPEQGGGLIEDTEEYLSILDGNSGQLRQVIETIGAIGQLYLNGIKSRLDSEKMNAVATWAQANFQYFQDPTSKEYIQRGQAIVNCIGDTGAGKETFYKNFLKYGLIPLVTGTGGITKDHERFYRVFEKTMSGVRVVADAGGFITVMEPLSMVVGNKIRKIQDSYGMYNVGIHCDGVTRSESQLKALLGDIPRDLVGAFHLRISPDSGMDRFFIRIASRLKKGRQVRSDDLVELMMADQAQLSLATVTEIYNTVVRASAVTDPIEIGRRMKREALSRGVSLNEMGRYFLYHSKTLPEIAVMMRNFGLDVPVIYTDELTPDEVFSAVTTVVKPEKFPIEAIRAKAAATRESVKEVLEAKSNFFGKFKKLVQRGDTIADISTNVTNFVKSKYERLKSAISLPSKSARDLTYTHNAYYLDQDRFIIEQRQSQGTLKMMYFPQYDRYELGVIVGAEKSGGAIVWLFDEKNGVFRRERLTNKSAQIIEGWEEGASIPWSVREFYTKKAFKLERAITKSEVDHGQNDANGFFNYGAMPKVA